MVPALKSQTFKSQVIQKQIFLILWCCRVISSSINPHLVAVFTLAWPEYSVVQRIQWVVEVGLLEAVVVQNLQGVKNPPYGEPWRKITEIVSDADLINLTTKPVRAVNGSLTCRGLLTLIERPPELHRLASLLHLLLDFSQLCADLRRRTRWENMILTPPSEDQWMRKPSQWKNTEIYMVTLLYLLCEGGISSGHW